MTVVIITAGVVIFLAPSIIAENPRHRNYSPIVLLTFLCWLKDSFDYSNRVLATLTANNALDRVEGRYAGPNTKLGISVAAVWHMADHYGQLVEYLRLTASSHR